MHDVIAEACDDPWSADVLHPSAHSWNGVVGTILALKFTFLPEISQQVTVE